MRRSADPTDRRSSVIELTEAGHDVVRGVRETVHRSEREWLSVLTDDELRAYIGQLHRIQDSLARSDTAA